MGISKGRSRRNTFCTAELSSSINSFDSYFEISRMSRFPGEMEHLRRARSSESLVQTPLPPQYDGTAEQRKAKKSKKANKKKKKKGKKTVGDSSQGGPVDDQIDQVESLAPGEVADTDTVDHSGEHAATPTPFIVHGETPTDRAGLDLNHGQNFDRQLGRGSIGDASKEQDTTSESTTIREMSVHSGEDRVNEGPLSATNDGSDPFVCHTHRRVACKFDPRCCVHRDPMSCSCPPRWSCCCLHHLGDCCHCVSVSGPTTHEDDDNNNNNQEEPPNDQGQDPSTKNKDMGEEPGNPSHNTQVDLNGSKEASTNKREKTSERSNHVFEDLSQVSEGDTEKVFSDDGENPKEDNKSDSISDGMGEKKFEDEDWHELNVEEGSGAKTVDTTENKNHHENEDMADDKSDTKTVEMIEHKNEEKFEKPGDEKGAVDKAEDKKEEMPIAPPTRPPRPTELMGPLAAHLFAKLLRGEFSDSTVELRSAMGNFAPIEFHVHKIVASQSALAAACFHSSNRIVAVVRENFVTMRGFELAFWYLYGHPLVTRTELRALTLAAFGYTQEARGQLNFHVNAAMADLAICYATSGVFFQLHAVAEAGFTMIAELVDWDTAELILSISLEIPKFAVHLEVGAGLGHEQVHNQNIARELQEMWAPLLIKAVSEFICKYVKENEGFALFAGAQSTVMPDRIPESLRSFPSAVMANPKLSAVKFGSFSTVPEPKPSRETVITSAILINLPFEQLRLTFTIMTARNVLSVGLAEAVISAREARRQQALHLLPQQSGPGRSAGAGELGYREYLAGTAPGPQTSPTEVELRREWVGVAGAVSEPRMSGSETATVTARE